MTMFNDKITALWRTHILFQIIVSFLIQDCEETKMLSWCTWLFYKASTARFIFI